MAFDVTSNIAESDAVAGVHYYRIEADDAEATSRALLGAVPRFGTIYRIRATASANTILPRILTYSGDLAQTIAAFGVNEIGQPPVEAADNLDALCALPYRLTSDQGLMVEFGGTGTKDARVEVWIRNGIGGI